MASHPEYSDIFSSTYKYELYHIPLPNHICNDCVKKRAERDFFIVLFAIIFAIILFIVSAIYQWTIGLISFPAILIIIYWDGKALIAPNKYFAGKISRDLTKALDKDKGKNLRVLTQEEYDDVKRQTFRGAYEEYMKKKGRDN